MGSEKWGNATPWQQKKRVACVVVVWPKQFLSRVDILMRDIDLAILSVRLSVCPFRSGILYENGSTYYHNVFTAQ